MPKEKLLEFLRHFMREYDRLKALEAICIGQKWANVWPLCNWHSGKAKKITKKNFEETLDFLVWLTK